ncbi:hypothetical protein [Sphaerotilus sp.]|uniref:hypothetical protein n=1 Tax=Sphaerotilus sp. TaxID=2093942 RepID=UPI002ACD4D71|nr:hypothetical protein [Sphaerotilus sp.]MDZ7858603.1 hypothetical protein [Sphaerotilus sp.]
MHPLFAQLPQLLLRRRAARHEPVPVHILRTTLPPSREMGIRRATGVSRSSGGMVLPMKPPPRPPLSTPCPPPATTTAAAIDIVLDALQALTPIEACDAGPVPTTRAAETDGVHLRIDPQDHQRVRISGSMREVCAALDALIAVQ